VESVLLYRSLRCRILVRSDGDGLEVSNSTLVDHVVDPSPAGNSLIDATARQQTRIDGFRGGAEPDADSRVR
jgi:hypothetical protein